jgi:hypothetical protein
LNFFKVRKIISYLPIYLKICKVEKHEPWLAKYNVPGEMTSFQDNQFIQWVLAINTKWAIMSAMSSRVTLWWDDGVCLVLEQHLQL